MALQTPLSFAGLSIPAAYIRVDSVFGGKPQGWTAVVRVYASAATANPTAPAVPQFLREFNVSAPYDATNVNPFDLLYKALLTLPEYAAALSV